jgi:hypothetical protein
MLLLFPNEGVLTAIGKSRWRVTFGSEKTRVRGREILFPNLLLPHRPIFKLSWECEGLTEQVPTVAFDWGAQKVLFKDLVMPVYGIAIAQFIVFPYVILFFLTDISIISSLAYLYVSILISLFLVYRKREIFHLSKRKFLSLGFECLVCPPVAVNLIRKLSLGLPGLKQDLLMVSRNLLEADEWHSTKDTFISRIVEEIDFEEENTPRLEKLITHRDILLKEASG